MRTLEQITSRRPIVVGIFQNQSIDFIMNVMNECGLDMIQLHGNEGMEASNSKNYVVPVRILNLVVVLSLMMTRDCRLRRLHQQFLVK